MRPQTPTLLLILEIPRNSDVGVGLQGACLTRGSVATCLRLDVRDDAPVFPAVFVNRDSSREGKVTRDVFDIAK